MPIRPFRNTSRSRVGCPQHVIGSVLPRSPWDVDHVVLTHLSSQFVHTSSQTQQPYFSRATTNSMASNKFDMHKLADEFAAELKHIGQTGAQAIASLAWLWPLRGIYFALTHPGLVRPLLPNFLTITVVSILSTFLFFAAYFPQAAFLFVITGPLAPFLAIPLVLAEAYALFALLARPLFLEPALARLFDAALGACGQGSLVREGKTRRGAAADAISVRPFRALSLQGSGKGLIRYLVSLPLNLVPGVGTATFLLYNGHRAGPGWHSRYFALKGWGKAQRQEFVKKHDAAYTAFGVATMILNLIPFLGFVLTYTNTIGAAMWAAKLEAQQNIIDSSQPAEVLESDKTKKYWTCSLGKAEHRWSERAYSSQGGRHPQSESNEDKGFVQAKRQREPKLAEGDGRDARLSKRAQIRSRGIFSAITA
ncbi:hypothetical protein CERSUDRAFT_122714 [Gelatoporia subvermispora B]|uniref:Uncharacterized protein n=1 Tax=Ceriporiopsis subvermispora (strain B) TaxID=914234 RepID=M2RLG7_CERS8|nr:hypothetical protein CERSUDRAFT_122714 [Gelatoporia subvermispora B]